MRLWLAFKFILPLLLAFVICLYVLDFDVESFIMIRRVKRDPRVKVILYWTKMFSNETFYLGKGDAIFADCPVKTCIATTDKKYTDIENFSAILFHGNELPKRNIPWTRGPNQWYVYVNLESPENRVLKYSFYDEFFNVSMTYRLDSDIYWPYAGVEDIETGEMVAPLQNVTWKIPADVQEDTPNSETEQLRRVIRGKSKSVAWFVSNCGARSGRMEYVREMSKYIDVDIYGECGNGTHVCKPPRECYREVVEPNYFFYLSFENTLCRDYVTEKLYRPLSVNIVPVVYGGANYSLFAPPDSYVNALDFYSPRELAEHLKALRKNQTEYEKYFRWKRHYRVVSSNRITRCKLCQMLHDMDRRQFHVLADFYGADKCPLHALLGKKKYATRATVDLLG